MKSFPFSFSVHHSVRLHYIVNACHEGCLLTLFHPRLHSVYLTGNCRQLSVAQISYINIITAANFACI